MSRVIDIAGLQFAWGPREPVVLDIETLVVNRGEKVFLRGSSGSGKSTLLGLIGGITTPDRGSVQVLGTNLESLRGAARDQFRADHIGLVFQQFNLIPYLPLLDNVCLPCRFSRRRQERAVAGNGNLEGAALALLERLGLDASRFAGRAVSELSVGQQQRVAAARALLGRPELVIADEPTSALDAPLRREFLSLLFEEVDNSNGTLLFVSHDDSLRTRFDRDLEMTTINRVPMAVT